MTMDTSQLKPPATATPPVAVNPKSQMGKDAFMKLLVAELKNQDPMNPMESRDMIAQLSTLSSVEKLNAIEEKLGVLSDIQSGASAIQNAALIGKHVQADTRSMMLPTSGATGGKYELMGGASSVSVKVRDGGGNLVKTLELGAQSIGPRKFAWDGMNEQGTRAPNGSYQFEITAKNAAGLPVVASTRVSGLVTEVTYENGAPEVVVGGSPVPLADVTSIAQ
jgi:flagellar basal-body rod modification protein FlgD